MRSACRFILGSIFPVQARYFGLGSTDGFGGSTGGFGESAGGCCGFGGLSSTGAKFIFSSGFVELLSVFGPVGSKLTPSVLDVLFPSEELMSPVGFKSILP